MKVLDQNESYLRRFGKNRSFEPKTNVKDY